MYPYLDLFIKIDKAFAILVFFLLFSILIFAYFKERSRQNYLRNLERIKKISKNIYLAKNLDKRAIALESIALRHSNKWKRIEAQLILGFANRRGSENVLKKNLFDRDEDVSYFAMLALGQIKISASARILLEYLRSNISSGYKIVSILEKFPADNIVPIVLEYVQCSDALVRFWSIKLLSRFPDIDLVSLLERFSKDESADVRAASCECLGMWGYQEAKDCLVTALSDRAWFVRMHAIRSLYKIAGQFCLPDIVPLIRDESWFVKESVEAIMSRHIDTVLPVIRECLADYDDNSKFACVNALVDSRQIAQVSNDALSQYPSQRDHAMELLGNLIKTKFYFGLKKNLGFFSKESREKLLNIIAEFDKELAHRLSQTGED